MDHSWLLATAHRPARSCQQRSGPWEWGVRAGRRRKAMALVMAIVVTAALLAATVSPFLH